jgi:hypothetical protein
MIDRARRSSWDCEDTRETFNRPKLDVLRRMRRWPLPRSGNAVTANPLKESDVAVTRLPGMLTRCSDECIPSYRSASAPRDR